MIENNELGRYSRLPIINSPITSRVSCAKGFRGKIAARDISIFARGLTVDGD